MTPQSRIETTACEEVLRPQGPGLKEWGSKEPLLAEKASQGVVQQSPDLEQRLDGEEKVRGWVGEPCDGSSRKPGIKVKYDHGTSL